MLWNSISNRKKELPAQNVGQKTENQRFTHQSRVPQSWGGKKTTWQWSPEKCRGQFWCGSENERKWGWVERQGTIHILHKHKT